MAPKTRVAETKNKHLRTFMVFLLTRDSRNWGQERRGNVEHHATGRIGGYSGFHAFADARAWDCKHGGFYARHTDHLRVPKNSDGVPKRGVRNPARSFRPGRSGGAERKGKAGNVEDGAAGRCSKSQRSMQLGRPNRAGERPGLAVARPATDGRRAKAGRPERAAPACAGGVGRC